MDTSFRLMPLKASTKAGQVDALYYYLLLTSATVIVLVAGLIVYYMVKYRKGSAADRRPMRPFYRLAIETTYIGVPCLAFASMFLWGAVLYFAQAAPPANAIDIRVVGKQWMWKLQHPSGRREINELHVPLGEPVRLTMISQDVIHSFYVPAFRVKHDVLPGRYTYAWFEASRVGEYHLFCAEYCGTNHSRMIGRVVVMPPSQYEEWLAGDRARISPVEAGRRLFEDLRCASCHQGATPRGPALEHLYGSQVKLQNGQTVVADEAYLRESILEPQAKVTAGFQPVMPSFAGQLDEEAVLDLIAFLKSHASQPRTPAP